jgi:hypothetical protein
MSGLAILPMMWNGRKLVAASNAPAPTALAPAFGSPSADTPLKLLSPTEGTGYHGWHCRATRGDGGTDDGCCRGDGLSGHR